jgi:hypothetical protein
VTMSVCGRVAEIQHAMAMRSASRSRKPMTCKPMGRAPTASKGSDAAVLRKYELTIQTDEGADPGLKPLHRCEAALQISTRRVAARPNSAVLE